MDFSAGLVNADPCRLQHSAAVAHQYHKLISINCYLEYSLTNVISCSYWIYIIVPFIPYSLKSVSSHLIGTVDLFETPLAIKKINSETTFSLHNDKK